MAGGPPPVDGGPPPVAGGPAPPVAGGPAPPVAHGPPLLAGGPPPLLAGGPPPVDGVLWEVISATIRILLSFKSGHVLKLLEPIFTLLEVHMPCRSKPLIGD